MEIHLNYNKKQVNIPKCVEKMKQMFPPDFFELFYFFRTFISNSLHRSLLFIF